MIPTPSAPPQAAPEGLDDFLSHSSALLGSTASDTRGDRAARRIVGDLVASPRRLVGTYVLANVAGYALSLAVCAQNGVGLFAFSHDVAAGMHVIPWPWCPIVCGALFSTVPNLLPRLFLTPFQQRYLFWRLGWLLALAPLTAATILALCGERDPAEFFHGLAHGSLSAGGWMALWTLGALGSAAVLEFAFARLLFRSRASVERACGR